MKVFDWLTYIFRDYTDYLKMRTSFHYLGMGKKEKYSMLNKGNDE
jgi:predicted DNA-binding transcriptional regulator AlpA